MTTMLSHNDCLAKAIELERRAEAAPASDRNYHNMAAAWRRLAVQSEWQDRLLAMTNDKPSHVAARRLRSCASTLAPPPDPTLITFNHTERPGRFVFSSPELPGWKCVGRSRGSAGEKVIGSWRTYLGRHPDLDAGIRAALVGMIPHR
jgi:hypothetical protein